MGDFDIKSGTALGRHTASQGPAPTHGGAAVVRAVPELHPGESSTILKGVVSGRDPQGHLVIRTDRGELVLNTRLPLTPGTKVTVQIQAAAARLQAVILSVDGQPLKAGLPPASTAPSLSPSAPAVSPGPAGQARSPDPAGGSTGTMVPGTKASAAPTGDGQGHGGPKTRAVVIATLTPLAGHSPASGRAGDISAPALAKQATTQVFIRLVGGTAAPAGSPEATTAAAAARGRALADLPLLQGHLGQDSGKTGKAAGLVIESAIGTMRIGPGMQKAVHSFLAASQSGPEAPPLRTVFFQLLGPADPAADRLSAAGPRIQALLKAVSWPSFAEAAATLEAQAPAEASTLLSQLGGSRAQGIISSALFLLAALRGGHVQNWLGEETMRILEQAGRRDLVQRLADDFTQMARQAGESNEWRSLLLPLYDDKHMHYLRLAWHHHQAGGENEDGETRFLVDLELSRLGALQLDGLITRDQRFDLILRSRQDLATPHQDAISGIFLTAIESCGYHGQIVFRQEDAFATPGAAATSPFLSPAGPGGPGGAMGDGLVI